MKSTTTLFISLVLSLLSACTSPTEQAGLKEVVDLYGGTALLRKGTGVSTTASDSQGSYLAVDLTSTSPGKYYSDLNLPASNCAYLVYNHLTPDERKSYDYFKVIIQDSASSHTYTFSPADLTLASQAGGALTTLLANLQQQDYPAVAESFDSAALGTTSRDSVLANLRRFGQRLAPFNEYTVHGFKLAKDSLAGQSKQMVRFLVSVPHTPEKPVLFAVSINPNAHSPQFLYGIGAP